MSFTVVLLVCLVGTQPPCPAYDPVTRELGPTWMASVGPAESSAPQRVRGA